MKDVSIKMPKQLEFQFMKSTFAERWRNIWVVDFEYSNIGGSLVPSSVAIKNISPHLKEQQTKFTCFRDKNGKFIKPTENPFEDGYEGKHSGGPFYVNSLDLFVGYTWEAESTVFEELGWDHPMHIIDMYVEIKNFWNGYSNKFKSHSLRDVVDHLGIEHNYLPEDKSNLRQRLGNDTIDWSSTEERKNVERYNIEDVEVTAKLFQYWQPIMTNFDRSEQFETGYWEQALSRGLDADIVGQIDRKGYPIDVAAWDATMRALPDIKQAVIEKAHASSNCFPGGAFSNERFRALLEDKNLISYFPRTVSGKIKTDQEALRTYEDIEEIKLIKEALYIKNATKLNDLPIDRRDNRAKTNFWIFGAKTGRATPSTSKHILNMAGCFRPFVRATDEASLVTIDYEQQEFGIAAKLSEDPEMLKAYWSKDPYLTLGKQAGVIPQDAEGKDHPKRAVFKTVCLMTQYGAGAASMASNMKGSIEEAEMALQHHQRVFHIFWQNQEKVMDKFLMDSRLILSDGFNLKIEPGSTFREFGNHRGYSENTLRNWPIQSSGCQIMRKALQRLYRRECSLPIGIMHDEFIFENIMVIDEDFHQHQIDKWTTEIVEAANDIIGMPLKTEAKIIKPGERFPVKHEKDMELFKLFAEIAGFNV